MKTKGTQSQVQAVEVGLETVFIRSNIQWIETEEFTGWEYDEEQVPKEQYLENVQQLKTENADLAFDLMVAGGEAKTARQEIADLNFQLMMDGVI